MDPLRALARASLVHLLRENLEHVCNDRPTNHVLVLKTTIVFELMKKGIGRAESEVLQFVAEQGDVPVREVADHFADAKGWVRPTVLKMMERLREKGYLEREVKDGVYHYRSVDPKEELDRSMLEGLVRGPFRGSVSPMVAFLVEQDQVSDEDLAQLRQLVEDLEKKRKKNKR